MIVVDANVVVYFLIEGDRTQAARELMRRDPDWRLPALWRHEYLNVLATLVRAGGATLADGRGLWRLGIEGFGQREEDLDMDEALALAAEHRVSAYDAQYLVLARRLRTVCVTDDRRLQQLFPQLARGMQA